MLRGTRSSAAGGGGGGGCGGGELVPVLRMAALGALVWYVP